MTRVKRERKIEGEGKTAEADSQLGKLWEEIQD